MGARNCPLFLSKGFDMNELYSIKEIRESKLIYDWKPPAFGGIMTVLTLLSEE